MAKNGAVTTPRGRDDLEHKARGFAAGFGLPFIPRQSRPFSKLLEENSLSGLLVVTDELPVLQTRTGPLEYHEGTAVLRTNPANKSPDAIVRAMQLEPGSTVLDCTLGMAVDALVAAASLDRGRVTGLESSVMLHALVAGGIGTYHFRAKRLAAASTRIVPVHADYNEFLRSCGRGEYDVVYFDPMFDKPVAVSTMMQRVREVADGSPVTGETMELARRAAKKRVVLKGRRGCFSDIEFDEFIPSGGSIFYGVIDA